MVVCIEFDNEKKRKLTHIEYCRMLNSSILCRTRRFSLDNRGLASRPDGHSTASSFSLRLKLLSCNLRTDIHQETTWQKMVTANIAVLH